MEISLPDQVSDRRTLVCIDRSAVTHAGDVSRCPCIRYADATMLTIASGQVKAFSVLLVSISLIALVVLAIAFGIHAFLAAVGHYAPWEQIWAG